MTDLERARAAFKEAVRTLPNSRRTEAWEAFNAAVKAAKAETRAKAERCFVAPSGSYEHLFEMFRDRMNEEGDR